MDAQGKFLVVLIVLLVGVTLALTFHAASLEKANHQLTREINTAYEYGNALKREAASYPDTATVVVHWFGADSVTFFNPSTLARAQSIRLIFADPLDQ